MTRLQPTSHFLLIGPSGAGKSTVGALLAQALNLPFHDSDAAVERAAGQPLAQIFDKEGEVGFRMREAAALRDLLDAEPAVIAVGAGALLDLSVAARLRAQGRVVLLDAQPATLAARLGAASDRPLLAGATDLSGRLESQRLTRDPIYRALAHHAITTDGLTPTAVVAAVAACCNAGPAGAPR